MPSLAIVTCTGGRPEAFELCERWMKAQTRQPDQWIVVDDFEVPTDCTMGQTVVRPEPFWQPGDRTLSRNLIAGLELVDCDKVAVIEDDDYYSPSWLETVDVMLEHFDLFGEGWTRYFHVGTRLHHLNSNDKHASLCATAWGQPMTAPIVDFVKGLNPQNPFIDGPIWQRFGDGQRLNDTHLVVGMKGMPGRVGCGKGHAVRQGTWTSADLGLSFLRELIGSDAEAYERFYSGPELTAELIALCSNPMTPNCATPPNEMRRRQRRLLDLLKAGGADV